MNLIFLSIFEEFQNLFKDGFLSKIDTDALADSNARDLVRSYFERNPLPEMDTNNPGMEIILNGLANVQNFVGEISMGEGSLIASAPILLLAASVVIILGVLGEAFFKKDWNSRHRIFDDTRCNDWTSTWNCATSSCYRNCSVLCSTCINHNHV